MMNLFVQFCAGSNQIQMVHEVMPDHKMHSKNIFVFGIMAPRRYGPGEPLGGPGQFLFRFILHKNCIKIVHHLNFDQEFCGVLAYAKSYIKDDCILTGQ